MHFPEALKIIGIYLLFFSPFPPSQVSTETFIVMYHSTYTSYATAYEIELLNGEIWWRR